MTAKISVIIPVYNEINTIREIIKRVQAVDIEKEIIIVDDGSMDGTKEYLKSINEKVSDKKMQSLKIFFNETNRGKGAALKTGFKEASNDIIVIQDADLEYDPEDYNKLIEPIIKGLADVVYGSRFLGDTHRVLYYWHYVGNTILTLISNMLTNLNLSDVWTGYKVFKKEVVKNMNLVENGFGFGPEITAKISKLNLRIYEVPISYHGRTYEEGKKITWKDGLKAFWYILRYKFI